jgi:hypothetical protein
MKTLAIALAVPSLLLLAAPAMAQRAPFESCWGQATAVFAEMGEMGEHASEQLNPRAGLRNLARLLYDDGVLVDDTMSALGQFVADELGLSIDACM